MSRALIKAPPSSLSASAMTGYLSKLPPELIDEVLRHSLSIDYNRTFLPPQPPSRLELDQHFDALIESLTASLYLTRGMSPETNPCMTSKTNCTLYPGVLRTCKFLHGRGIKILYLQNNFVAIHTSVLYDYVTILIDFGVSSIWGPFPASSGRESAGGKVVCALTEHSHQGAPPQNLFHELNQS